MNRIQKWLPIGLALIAGVVIGWWVTQQSSVTPSQAQTAQGSEKKLPPKLSASATPPPEVQQLEELKKAGGPPEQKSPNTRESVLEKLRSSRSGNARPASSGPPPEVQQLEELKKAGTPPAQRQPHTTQELLDKIRSMPGGPEMIEEAKKRGARIGMGSDKSGPYLSYLNLFRVKEAEAQGTFSVTLNPGNNWYSSSPVAYAGFVGAFFFPQGVPSTTPYMNLYSISSPTTTGVGTQIILPHVYFLFNAPNDGWYIINFDASGVQASLMHYEGGTFPTVASWNYSGRTGTQSYPAMLELTAGFHSFYWVSSLSSGFTSVYEANAFHL